jgi:hypothetical protein
MVCVGICDLKKLKLHFLETSILWIRFLYSIRIIFQYKNLNKIF